MNPPNDAPDLSYATSDELIDELFRRYEHGIVSLMRIRVDTDDENSIMDYTRSWHGNTYVCCGLADGLKHRLLTQTEQTEHKQDDP